MLSESARMHSAAEARFRVQAPNSLPRTVKVIALDAAGEAIAARLAGAGRTHAVLTAASPDGALRTLSGGVRTVAEELDGTDLVLLVAGPGGHAHAAPSIGEACSLRRVMTTGVVIGSASASEDELSKTLAQLRPWSLMVVLARSDDYIEDMMTALRA
jgi:hypothetical protein